MPNVAAGLGLLGLGVMVVVAVGTIAYSLFYDQPHHNHHHGDGERYSYERGNEAHSPRNSSTVTKPTRRKKKERDNSSEFTGSDSCSICKDVIKTDALKKLPCYHCFHHQCIYDWFDISASSVFGKITGTCPMCRKPFSAEDLI
ncbi:E3 ubiquitin-protein ligase RNF115-like [Planococcus citri]|uniref:E3 ubiquitin-protein ligase RNF115-like n=1 Tax=Planococcus citri TaxID=170843 RepID=UPI0031F9D257